MSGRLTIGCTVALGCALLSACAADDRDSAARTTPAVESIFTDLEPDACRQQVDPDDPNDTPVRVCPGVGGYTLVVRRVESGRVSVDVVDPTGRAFPLELQEVLTRAMSSLRGRAEWRVSTVDGSPVPVAVILAVQAREDDDDPARITHTWVATAKVTADTACVTSRLPDDSARLTDARPAADSARDRPCVAPLPPLDEVDSPVR